MKYQRPSFQVAMPHDAEWPLERKPEVVDATAQCQECGANRSPGTPHMDARDAGRPRRRVCFGKVIA